MKKIPYMLVVALVMLALTSLAAAPAADNRNFKAHLTGDQEVPPPGVVIETLAQGQVIFHLSKDGDALDYKLIVANIENVTAAHIHCAAPGVNGLVGVTLYSSGSVLGGGRVDGVIASGTITAPDPGNGCGWDDLDEVLAAMRSGNTYVNVHTNDGVAPTNTGAGDFPGGEIRGQIR